MYDDYFKKEEFSPFRSLIGLITFSTILPFKTHTSLEELTRMTWAWPFIQLVIGVFGALLALLSINIFHFNTFLTAAIVYGFLLLISGFNHVDGIMDMGDGIMIHGSPSKKLKAMKDHVVGAGGISTMLIIALLTVGALDNILDYKFFVGIVIAEMLTKTSLITTCLTSKPLSSGIGMYFIKATNLINYIISTVLVTIVAYLLGGFVGIFGVLGAILSGALVSLIAKKNFKVANGDVLGTSSELGRVFALIFMLIMYVVI